MLAEGMGGCFGSSFVDEGGGGDGTKSSRDWESTLLSPLIIENSSAIFVLLLSWSQSLEEREVDRTMQSESSLHP